MYLPKSKNFIPGFCRDFQFVFLKYIAIYNDQGTIYCIRVAFYNNYYLENYNYPHLV